MGLRGPGSLTERHCKFTFIIQITITFLFLYLFKYQNGGIAHRKNCKNQNVRTNISNAFRVNKKCVLSKADFYRGKRWD